MQSVYSKRIMKKNAAEGYEKTKPIQTQLKFALSAACPELAEALSAAEGVVEWANQTQSPPSMAAGKPAKKPGSLRYRPFAHGRRESIICPSVECIVL